MPVRHSKENDADRLGAALRALAESERRYRMLFEEMSHGVVYQNSDGKITDANLAAQRILGMTLEMMRGRAAIDPRWRAMREDGTPCPDDERASIRTLRTGLPSVGVVTGVFNPALNEIRWICCNATPELNPADGSISGVISIFEDITDQRRSKQAEAVASRTVIMTLENVTDAFFALDREWRYTYVNRRGEQVTRRTREELLGQCVWDVYPDLVGGVFYERYHEAMNGGGPVTFEEFYSASQIWYRAHAYGTPDGIAVFLRDVSAERLADDERRTAEERQREFMRDVLASVTGGKLRLCFSDDDLPGPCPDCSAVLLTLTEGLRPLRLLADEAARALNFADDRRNDLVTAVSEAGMNAVVHAGGGAACVRILPGRMVQIWIRDEGPGISIEHLPRATLQKGFTTAGTLGHGMKMMLRAVDRVYLRTSPSGATVVLEQGSHAEPTLLLNEW